MIGHLGVTILEVCDVSDSLPQLFPSLSLFICLSRFLPSLSQSFSPFLFISFSSPSPFSPQTSNSLSPPLNISLFSASLPFFLDPSLLPSPLVYLSLLPPLDVCVCTSARNLSITVIDSRYCFFPRLPGSMSRFSLWHTVEWREFKYWCKC